MTKWNTGQGRLSIENLIPGHGFFIADAEIESVIGC
jgi:hypothetical protein